MGNRDTPFANNNEKELLLSHSGLSRILGEIHGANAVREIKPVTSQINTRHSGLQ
jgi:hypothetical protein